MGRITTILTGSSGSWICPAGVGTITVECIGEGGRGGQAIGNPSAGGGGGGGCYARSIVTVVPGTSYSYVINTSQVNGSTSFNNGQVKAGTGLNATDGFANNINGTGGGTNTGQNVGNVVTYFGGTGANGNFTSGVTGGAGGGAAGSTGAGGNASAGTGGTGASLYGGNGANGVANSTDGAAGSNYGGGGSGGKANNNPDRTGGAGGSGAVIISYNSPADFFEFFPL